MEPRQFHQLAGQSSERYHALLSGGLSAVAENGLALEASAVTLAKAGQWRAAQVLRTVAEEEAGKFLILVDAARLGRHSQRKLRDQLKRAGDHLAKGLYAKATEIRPADFKELLGFLERERATLYLDGPNDVDWIFRNEILSSREETLYVDLIRAETELLWLSPARFDTAWLGPDPPAAVRLMASLASLGCCRPGAPRVLWDVWRGFTPEADTHWHEVEQLVEQTIEQFKARGLVEDSFNQHDYRVILASWTFPLYGVEIKQIDIDPTSLAERRRLILEGLRAQDYGFEG